jgi:hypothetical protein
MENHRKSQGVFDFILARKSLFFVTSSPVVLPVECHDVQDSLMVDWLIPSIDSIHSFLHHDVVVVVVVKFTINNNFPRLIPC